jgi:hypothetical protein
MLVQQAQLVRQEQLVQLDLQVLVFQLAVLPDNI